jgi:AraC-like DNA-binding protein
VKIRHKKSTEDLLDFLLSEKSFLQASVLLKLFDEILESDNKQSLWYQADPFLRKIISYSEMNFHSRISLDDAASVVHLSRYHFCRKFKTRTGVSFNEYINNLRMENSILCLNKGMSVSQAAALSGFEDISYFIKRFRRMYGVSPGEYSVGNSLHVENNLLF